MCVCDKIAGKLLSLGGVLVFEMCILAQVILEHTVCWQYLLWDAYVSAAAISHGWMRARATPVLKLSTSKAL